MAGAEKADSAKAVGVSEGELEIAFSGPAVATNKFYVTLNPGGVRIAFTEQRNPTAAPVFRTAVMMPVKDGFALRDLLIRILKDVELQLQKAIEDSAKGG